jgi:hypothetical protein
MPANLKTEKCVIQCQQSKQCQSPIIARQIDPSSDQDLRPDRNIFGAILTTKHAQLWLTPMAVGDNHNFHLRNPATDMMSIW